MPIEETTVDIKNLKRLYTNNYTSKALLDYVAGRKNNSFKTDVDRILSLLNQNQNGVTVSRRDAISVMKELQRFNCGKFVIGRRGQPSRFEWTVQMIAVGKAARGEDTSIAPLAQGEASDTQDHGLPADTIRHTFQLRPDRSVSIELPSDLSSKESIRLAEFIKTLPFERAANDA